MYGTTIKKISCVMENIELIFCLYKDRNLELWWWKE